MIHHRRGTIASARTARSSLLGLMLLVVACGSEAGTDGEGETSDGERSASGAEGIPELVAAQAELFSTPGAQTNAWADADGDGDLDLFVGFRGAANRLYRNDRGVFVDVAGEVGLADEAETRAAAWGDYDLDGDPDLYVGYAAGDRPNRLYRNDRAEGFVDVAMEVGVSRGGVTRQPSWIDFDGDGDLDLFVAFRDGPNALFVNDGGVFVDEAEDRGVADPRRSVGAVWFDMDGDADLDLFVANQNGDEDGVFRNEGGRFQDVAAAWGMNQPGRTEAQGSVGVSVSDHDNDGDLDLFVASYGPDILWENQGGGRFVDVAPGTPLAGDHHSVAAAWGDVDNDGWVDLYVNTFVSGEPEARDFLFRNGGGGSFEDMTPPSVLERGSSHGVAWADFDFDGDIDLSLANNDPSGSHPLYLNRLPAAAGQRSLQVGIVDRDGRWSRAGATVTLHREADGYTSSRLMSTGGGYASQGMTPAHFGLPPGEGTLSISVVWFQNGAARNATVSGVQPGQFRGQWLMLQLGVD
ncbi:MAG: CRTAC1 family protein [Gemmatimonadetes bacterium]|nr:CRTAC1 family protein [Gemmatimonadota bacterium]NNF13708.1 CRTAC1 family protein [Gemmatimonadota bacterium]